MLHSEGGSEEHLQMRFLTTCCMPWQYFIGYFSCYLVRWLFTLKESSTGKHSENYTLKKLFQEVVSACLRGKLPVFTQEQWFSEHLKWSKLCWFCCKIVCACLWFKALGMVFRESNRKVSPLSTVTYCNGHLNISIPATESFLYPKSNLQIHFTI